MFEKLLLAMLGAAIGTAIRFLIIAAWPSQPKYFTAILGVNVLGATAMGLLYGAQINGTNFLFLGTGILGGLTTFSTMMTQSAQHDQLSRQIGYLCLQVLLGMLAFALAAMCAPALF